MPGQEKQTGTSRLNGTERRQRRKEQQLPVRHRHDRGQGLARSGPDLERTFSILINLFLGFYMLINNVIDVLGVTGTDEKGKTV